MGTATAALAFQLNEYSRTTTLSRTRGRRPLLVPFTVKTDSPRIEGSLNGEEVR